ncbi:hypothetical protein [Stutzerimonas stutzeri]|uniref:hypothetical protein n=1 Tax=Stutzerimonas stutzeri TaxID=316 RepID=UPI001C2EC30F|nr:hypothetical protein [Stutzerimonas stutzeri]
MPIRHDQLAELLNLTAHSVTQLSEALTCFSLELMASEDPAVRIASRRMVSRVAALQSAFGQQLSAFGLEAPESSGADRAGEPLVGR